MASLLPKELPTAYVGNQSGAAQSGNCVSTHAVVSAPDFNAASTHLMPSKSVRPPAEDIVGSVTPVVTVSSKKADEKKVAKQFLIFELFMDLRPYKFWNSSFRLLQPE